MSGREGRLALVEVSCAQAIKWVAVIIVTGILLFVAATTVAAKWEDKGIQGTAGGKYIGVHLFEYVEGDGKVYSRIFVPELVALGGTLATRIDYLYLPDGQVDASIWRLELVGIEPEGVELLLFNGPADSFFWSTIKTTPSLHHLAKIEKEDEMQGTRLSFRVTAGTITLWVSGFTAIRIDVRPEGTSSLAPKASLVQ